jgi:hypothetical protein
MESESPRRRLQRWIVDGALPPAADEASAQALIEEAALQGMAGLLWAAVRSTSTSWPKAAHERLGGLNRSILFRAVQQLEVAAATEGALSAAGIPVVPLKGAAVCERLYDSPAERPMADVDLLVLGDWAGALRTVQARGLRPTGRGDHALVFQDPTTGVVLELHHSVTSCPGFHPLDADGIRRRAQTSATGRLRPSAEDLLVQLSLHAAFQHGLVLSLVQHLDFRRLLERGEIDVVRLLEAAEAGRAHASVAAALRLSEAVVGASVPGVLKNAFAPPPGLARLLDAARADPLALVAPALPRLARLRWELAAGRRAELLRRTLLPEEPGRRHAAWTAPFRAATRGAGLVWRRFRS